MRPVRGMKRGLATGKFLAFAVPLIGAGIALMSKRVRSAAFGKVKDAAENLRARREEPAPAPPQAEPVAAAPAPKPRAAKARKAPAKPAAKPATRTRKAPAKPKGSKLD